MVLKNATISGFCPLNLGKQRDSSLDPEMDRVPPEQHRSASSADRYCFRSPHPFWVQKSPVVPKFEGQKPEIVAFFKTIDRVEVELSYR